MRTRPGFGSGCGERDREFLQPCPSVGLFSEQCRPPEFTIDHGTNGRLGASTVGTLTGAKTNAPRTAERKRGEFRDHGVAGQTLNSKFRIVEPAPHGTRRSARMLASSYSLSLNAGYGT